MFGAELTIMQDEDTTDDVSTPAVTTVARSRTWPKHCVACRCGCGVWATLFFPSFFEEKAFSLFFWCARLRLRLGIGVRVA